MSIPPFPTGETTLLRQKLLETEDRLAIAEELLRAIRAGEVDALVVDGKDTPAVYTLKSGGEPYRLLVEQMAEGALTVSEDGVVLYCNSSFAQLVGQTRERIISRKLADFIAENGREDHVSALLVPDRGVRHELELRTIAGSSHVMISSVPLVVAGEPVHCMVVTDLSRQELRILHDAVVSASADAIFALNQSGEIESWNRAAAELFGRQLSEVLGRSIRILMPPALVSVGWDRVSRALAGETIRIDTRGLRKDGSEVDISVSLAPISDGECGVGGVSVMCRDITERRLAEQKIDLLMQEINHRSKNLLTVVQGVARLTAREGAGQQFAETFSARIEALAACHDLMVMSNWQGVEIGALVKGQLDFCANAQDPRIKVTGPSLQLKSKPAQSLGLALHELWTNATKYGALLVPEGRVHVRWEEGANGLHVLWHEENGPPVRPPRRHGFGTTLLERIFTVDTGGRADLQFLPEGVRCDICLPPSALMEVKQA